MSVENYHHCFACGKENPLGLKLSFEFDDSGRASASFAISSSFEGYPGVIHGGIISTILDEAMAKAVIHSGKVAYTMKLNLSFRKPLPSESQVIVMGWIVEDKGRIQKTAAKLYDENNLYAEAEAVFIVSEKEQ